MPPSDAHKGDNTPNCNENITQQTVSNMQVDCDPSTDEEVFPASERDELVDEDELEDEDDCESEETEDENSEEEDDDDDDTEESDDEKDTTEGFNAADIKAPLSPNSVPTCYICLNEFDGQDVGSPDSCENIHFFCLECLEEWSKVIL